MSLNQQAHNVRHARKCADKSYGNADKGDEENNP